MHMKDIAGNKAHRGAAVSVLLVAGIVLAGCGGSSSLTSSAATKTSSPSSLSLSAASSAAPSSTSTSKALTGNPNSTFCVEAAAEQAQEDKNTEALTGDSPADLQKFEEQSQAELKVFVSKAPSQIKSAVQTIADADNTLVNALKAVNYDITKLDSSAISGVDTPAFEAAVTTVDNYLEQVCGIHPTDDAS
jgi:hypothetical protein